MAIEPKQVKPKGYNLLVELHPGSKVFVTAAQVGVRGNGRGKVVAVGDSFEPSSRWEGTSVIFNPETAIPAGPDLERFWIVPDHAVMAVVEDA